MVIRMLPGLATLVATALLLDACSSVLGIEERRLRVEGPDAGTAGTGGQAGSGGAASGGSVGTGLVGPGPTGGGPGAGGAACAFDGLTAACTTCLCGVCDRSVTAACEAGTCIAAFECVARTGCSGRPSEDPAACGSPTVCGPELNEIADPSALITCLGDCPQCDGRAPCAAGAGCTTTTGTSGICLEGTCRNCTAEVSGGSSDCEQAYGSARACCSGGGACVPCTSAECEGAAPGDDCLSAPTVSGKGVCVDGACQQCNDPPGVFSNTCMLNVGGTRLCCGAAYECIDCPDTAGECVGVAPGSLCNSSPEGRGFCAQGLCRACDSHGATDPLCQSTFGAARACCNQDGTGCEPCPAAATCPTVPCVGGLVCTAGVCGACQYPGQADPACAVYGPGSDCCSLAGICGSCPAPSDLIDIAPGGMTFADIAAAGKLVAWSAVSTVSPPGALRGLSGGLPAEILDSTSPPTGPLGSDGVDTVFWAHAGGVRAFRETPAYAGEVVADNGVTAITADMTHLFWATSTGQVRRTLKSGAGSIEPLAFAGGAGTRIAVAGPALYWATLDRLHRTTTSGGSTDIVVAPGGGSIADFALGPSTVYWLTDGKVRSQNLEVLTDPSKSLVMSQAFPGFGGLTRVPEGDLFFTADTGLYRLKPDAGANNFELTLVATVQPPVGRVAHTSTHLYFIQANSKEIRRVARP